MKNIGTGGARAKLWTHLRAHRMKDVHFRNQHAMGNYVVDFCAPAGNSLLNWTVRLRVCASGGSSTWSAGKLTRRIKTLKVSPPSTLFRDAPQRPLGSVLLANFGLQRCVSLIFHCQRPQWESFAGKVVRTTPCIFEHFPHSVVAGMICLTE